MLTSPSVAFYSSRAERKAGTDAEVLEMWELLAALLRWRLAQRGRQFSAPAAPPVPPPGNQADPDPAAEPLPVVIGR